MIPTHLITHNGGFHADEVMSTVILTRIYPDAQRVRSRSRDWITPAPGRIIYDVGGGYDAEQGLFDHHQRGAPLREDGQPYSSFGLIWRHYGRQYLATFGLHEVDALHAQIDADFVLPVDLVDNGALAVSSAGVLAGMVLPGLIETLKPAFDDVTPDAEVLAFEGAVGIARAFIEARVGRAAAKLRAEAVVMAAIAAAGAGRVLELPMGMPFRSAVVAAGADQLLFVVHPREVDWCLTTIRASDEGFAVRADLPAAWAGLTGAALEAACGVPGAVFCHNARFVAAAKTREAALAMAARAVAAL